MSNSHGSVALKKNVDEFNSDVAANGGYRYSVKPSFSSKVANDRLTQATIDSILKVNPKRVVDIGCGDGVYTNALKEKFPHIEFCGLDPAATAIGFAQKSFPKIKFFVANALEPQTLPKEKFDLAILRGVLHHTSDPFLAIRNMEKIADHIVIIEPNGYNPVLKMIEKLSKYHREHEERSFSYGKLKSWCEKSGFQVRSCDYVGFVPFFFPTAIAKLIYSIQPVLEKIPFIRHFFSACYVIDCSRTNPRSSQ